MNTEYSINLVLDTKFEKNNLIPLFKKALDLGIKFFDEQADDTLDMPILTSKKATQIATQEKKEITDDPIGTLWGVFHDTSFFFYVFRKPNNVIIVSLLIFPESLKWIKKYKESDVIDYARYIRLLLKICEDYTVINLETEINY